MEFTIENHILKKLEGRPRTKEANLLVATTTVIGNFSPATIILDGEECWVNTHDLKFIRQHVSKLEDIQKLWYVSGSTNPYGIVLGDISLGRPSIDGYEIRLLY